MVQSEVHAIERTALAIYTGTAQEHIRSTPYPLDKAFATSQKLIPLVHRAFPVSDQSPAGPSQ